MRPPCPVCDTSPPDGAASCPVCDEPLPFAGDAEGEARAADRSIRRAFAHVRRLEALLTGNLVLCLLLLVLVGLQALGHLGHVWSPSATFLSVVAGALVVLAGLNLIAQRTVRRHPTAVVLMVAVPSTLALAGLVLLDTHSIWLSLWVASIWLLYPEARRIRALTAAHPDLAISRRLRGEDPYPGRERHGLAVARRAATRRQERAERTLRGALVVGLLLVIGAAWVFLGPDDRPALPPDPLPAVEGFERAWNEVDLEALAELRTPGQGPGFVRTLEVWQDRYGWGPILPPLEAPRWDAPGRGQTRVAVTYQGPDGELRTGFRLIEGRWYLSRLDVGDFSAWRPDPSSE